MNWKRLWIVSVLLGAVLMVGLLAGGYWYIQQRISPARLEAQIEEMLDRGVTIERTRLSLRGHLTLRTVTVWHLRPGDDRPSASDRNRERMVEVDRIGLKFSWFDLLRGRMQLSSVDVSGHRWWIRRDEVGNVDLLDAVRELVGVGQELSDLQPEAIRLNRLVLRSGQIHLVDRRAAHEATYQLNKGTVRFSEDGSGGTFRVDEFGPEPGTITAEGHWSADPFEFSMERFEVDNLDLDPFAAYLPQNNQVKAWQEYGELGGRFTRFELDAHELNFSGNFRVEDSRFAPPLDSITDGGPIALGVEGSLDRDTGRFRGQVDPLDLAGLPLWVEWDLSSLVPAKGRIQGGVREQQVGDFVGLLPATWRSDIEAVEGTAELTFQILFGASEPATTRGKLSVRDGEVRFDQNRRNWPDVSGMEGQVEYDGEVVRLKDGQLRLGDLGLRLENFVVRSPWGDPRVEGKIRAIPTSLDKVRRLAEELAWVDVPGDLKLSGTLQEGVVDVRGGLRDLEYAGMVTIGGVKVDHPLFPGEAVFEQMTVNLRENGADLKPAVGRMAGGKLEVRGRMDREKETWSVNFDAESRDASVEQVQGWIRERFELAPPSVQFSGTLDRSRVQVRGRLPEPDVTASLEASKLGARMPGGELEQINMSLTYEPGRLNVHRLTGQVAGAASRFEGKGWIAVPFGQQQPWDWHISATNFPIPMIISWLPDLFTGEEMDIGGSIDVEDARIEGTLLNPKFDGLVKIQDGVIRYNRDQEPIEDLELEIVLDDREIQVEEGSGRIEETPFRSTGDLQVENGVISFREGVFRWGGWPEISEMEGRVRFGDKRLVLSSFRLSLGTLKVILDELIVQPPWDDPKVNGQIRVDPVSLEELRRLGGVLGLVDVPEELSVTGTIQQGRMEVQGKLLDPKYDGTIMAREVVVDHPLFPGRVEFDDFTMAFNEDAVEFKPAVGRMVGGRVDLVGRLVRAATTWSVEVDIGITDVPADRMLDRYQQRAEDGISSYQVVGDLDRGNIRLRGTLAEPEIGGDLNASGLILRKIGRERGLENTTVVLNYREGRVELTRLTGRVEGADSRIDVSGEMQLPFEPGVAWSLNVDGEGLPLSLITPMLPPTVLGQEIEYRGLVDLQSVTVRGTPENPQFRGTIRLREGWFGHDPALEPLKGVGVTLELDEGVIRVVEGHGQLGNIPFRLKGNLRFDNGIQPDLSIVVDEASASDLMSWVTRLPQQDWKMDGSVGLRLDLLGTGEDYRFSGRINSSEIDWQGAQLKDLVGDLELTPAEFVIQSNRIQVFGGLIDGRFEIFRREVPRRFHVDASMSEVELGNLLAWMTGEDHPKRGRLRGSLNIVAPVDDPYMWDGTTEVRAQELDFRGVQAFEALSLVLNSSLSRVVETGVIGFLRGLLRLNPREAMTHLRSLISSQATTRFEKGTIDLVWEKGRGNLDFLLRNKEVRLEGSGWVESGGDLDVTVRVVPQAPVLNRIERDWLRGALSGGFQELRVTGSLQEPQFDTQKMRRGLLRFFPF